MRNFDFSMRNNMNKLTQRLIQAGVIAASVVGLVGCGGGGGGTTTATTGTTAAATTLSGTVAGGAAVIGTVIVTDSLGATKTTTIDTSGHYTVDVSGMTGPFVLKAAGTVGANSVTYYSAAVTADIGHTVNVTPFTNLMVSNIAAQLADTYFSNPANVASIGSKITAANLAAAETAMHAKLLPVLNSLGVSASIDLLRSSFSADHSGLDAALDMVKVEVDPTTNVATLKNAITQQVISQDDTTTTSDDSTAVDSTKITGITPSGVTDLQSAVTALNNFAALFATSLPTPTQLQNSGIFDTSSNFTMGGQSFAQFATQMTTDATAIGMKFSGVDVTLDPSGTSGILSFRITFASGVSQQLGLTVAKISGVWKITGDGRIADVSIEAQAQRNDWQNYNTSGTLTGSGTDMQNGLHINVDPFAYNNDSTHVVKVASALVTGPGLGNGIVMVPSTYNTWYTVQGMYDGDNQVRECGSPAPVGGNLLTSQCVNISQAVDNSVYTVVLKDSAGQAINGAGYTITLAKQPYATSVLTAAPASYFPALGGVTVGGTALTSPMQLVPNASVVVNWTMPAGIRPNHLNLWANQTTGASYFNVGKDLGAADTSKLVALPSSFSSTGIVGNYGVWLSGKDVYNRRLAVSKTITIN